MQAIPMRLLLGIHTYKENDQLMAFSGKFAIYLFMYQQNLLAINRIARVELIMNSSRGGWLPRHVRRLRSY